MGRRKTPTQLKVVRGNPGRRPLPENEPEPEIVMADPPPHITGYALEEWDRVMPQLYALQLISEIDRAAFAAYCNAYGRWRDAEEAIARMAERDHLTKGLMIKTTNGNAIQNPLVGTANKAAADMMRYADSFGMTPSARARLGESGGPPKDPAGKFFD